MLKLTARLVRSIMEIFFWFLIKFILTGWAAKIICCAFKFAAGSGFCIFNGMSHYRADIFLFSHWYLLYVLNLFSQNAFLITVRIITLFTLNEA